MSLPKIAIVAGSYFPDQCGVSHYTQCLRSGLRKLGYDTVVFTTYDAAAAADDPSVRGVIETWELRNLPKLAEAIVAQPFDLLHIQHAAGSYRFRRSIFLLPLLLRLRAWRHPIISTIHEYGWWEWTLPRPFGILLEWLKEWGQRHQWWDREDGFLLTLSENVIATHAQTVDKILERLPTFDGRVHHIPLAPNVEVLPTDRSLARQEVRHAFDWPDDATVITFFGFVHPVKGLETLLSAFERIHRDHAQTRLLLMGGIYSVALPGEHAEDYQAKLVAQIKELDLEGAVAFTGHLPNGTISRYLQGSDIGVLPFNHGVNLKSGSLLALLSHGLPTIITRNDPPVAELESNHIAAVVNPKAIDELEHNLGELLSCPEKRAALGRDGHNFSRAFSWETILQRHSDLYRRHMPQPISVDTVMQSPSRQPRSQP